MPDLHRLLPLLLLLALALAACGEPEVDLDVPPRGADQHLLDVPGVVGAGVEERLREVSEATGLDVVGLAFEDERTSLGQADRGGRLLLREWDADVVLVAVARPGDFTSDEADRSRFFGVYATDRFDVSRGLRERIIFERVQLLAAENEWGAAFLAALDELEDDIAGAEG
jgi:hypothetical protein